MSEQDYSNAHDRTRGLWGGPPADDDGEVEGAHEGVHGGDVVVVDELEGNTYLDDEQLARVEALTAARTVLLVAGGVFGAQPKLEPWSLTYVAEWILKGPEQDADETDGTDAARTDAEDDAPTDGGRVPKPDLGVWHTTEP